MIASVTSGGNGFRSGSNATELKQRMFSLTLKSGNQLKRLLAGRGNSGHDVEIINNMNERKEVRYECVGF
jgi:hypothetical protein